MRRRGLLAGLGALAAGCAAPREPASTAPAPLALPAQWQSPPAAAAGAEAPAPGWWRAFGDPVLAQWVERALAGNADLATAAARVQEARAQERVARAQRWPSLDLAVGATRSRSVNAFGQPSAATATQPVFQAAYEVDLFGRVAQQLRAAEAGTAGAGFARDAAALSVAAATASAYVTLRTLDTRLALLRQTQRSREDALRVAARRASVGYTSDLEWRQAQAELEATAQQVPAAENAVARQAHALSLLAGEAPGPVARGEGLQPPPLPQLLPSELLRRRPDVAQAEAALAASDATLAGARAQFLPSLRLTATVGQVASSALADPVAIWTLGASVLAPLLSAGRLQGQLDAAAARRDQAAWAYRRAVLTALREVEDQLTAVARLREQRLRLQAQRDAVAQALRLATRRYEAGYAPYLEQLDAQRSLQTAELALVQSQGDELLALVALHQALGGGWTPAPASPG